MQQLFFLHVAGASILLADHSNVGLCVSKVCVYLTANLFKIIVTRSAISGSKFTKNRLAAGPTEEITVLPQTLAAFMVGSPGKGRGRGSRKGREKEEGRGKEGWDPQLQQHPAFMPVLFSIVQ